MRWEIVVCNYKVEKKCEREENKKRTIRNIQNWFVGDRQMNNGHKTADFLRMCCVADIAWKMRWSKKKDESICAIMCAQRIFTCSNAHDVDTVTRSRAHIYQYDLVIGREMASGTLWEINLKNYTSCIVCISVNFLITAFSNLIKWQKWNETRARARSPSSFHDPSHPIARNANYAPLSFNFHFGDFGLIGWGTLPMHHIRRHHSPYDSISHEFQLSQWPEISYVNWKPTQTYQSLLLFSRYTYRRLSVRFV